MTSPAWAVSVAGLSALLGLVSGCGEAQPNSLPTVPSGPFVTGQPRTPIAIEGTSWKPCPQDQADKFPKTLPRMAPGYYAGPWCSDVPEGHSWMWLYARPLSPREAPESVRAAVNQDARIMSRDLRIEGYSTIVAPVPAPADVDYVGQREGSPNVLRISVAGMDVPPSGVVPTPGASPLRLVITLQRKDASPWATNPPVPSEPTVEPTSASQSDEPRRWPRRRD